MKLTVKQARLLGQIAGVECATVEFIRELQGATKGADAVLKMLRRLENAGLIERSLLHPELGGHSERYWYLSRRGAKLEGSGRGFGDPSPQVAQHLIPTFRPPGKGLSSRQKAVLTLLAETKQLTGDQIGSYVFSQNEPDRTKKLLGRLREQEYIRSSLLSPGRRLYWMLTKKGADAVSAPYGSDYRRQPSAETLAGRGLKLTARKNVEAAGWRLLFPSRRRQPPSSDPREILVRAVLAIEREKLSALMRNARPLAELKERVERHNRGDVGITVPETISDCVAAMPGRPEPTAVLILNPSYPSENFWLRRPKPGADDWLPPEPRVERYRLLAEVLPVLAVVEDETALQSVTGFLAGTRYQIVLLSELTERLRDFAKR